MRRAFLALVLLVALIPQPALAGDWSVFQESQMVDLVDTLRINVGVQPLVRHPLLDNYARWWAKYLALGAGTDFSISYIVHSPNLTSLLGPWWIIGENIGVAGYLAPSDSVDGIFVALSDSPTHYANMVNPRFAHIGIGVFVDEEGRIWIVQIFGGW